MIAAMVAAIVGSTTAAFSQAPPSLDPTAQAPAAPFFDDQLEYRPVVPDPTPSPTRARAVPKPAPTATPTTRPSTVRMTSSGRSASWAAGQWGRFKASTEASALCIAHHESWHAGLWKAIYRGPVSSTASGFAQWLDSTWRAQAKRAGVGTQYRRAYQAPAAVQAAVFAYQAEHYGLYPWAGTNCPGT